MTFKSGLKYRLVMAGGHLLFSLLAVAVVASIVFGIWYPEPFRTLSGGLSLFVILVSVDVMLGPLATASISSPEKAFREWRMDMALIVFVQLAALGYGIWTIYQARPVYMVFELDRFRVVHAFEVSKELLVKAPDQLRKLPQLGPGLLAVRAFKDASENEEATMAALLGVELSFRPDLWIPYDHADDALRMALKPLSGLIEARPAVEAQMRMQLNEFNLPLEKAAYLPLHSRTAIWTAVVNTDTFKPVFYLDFDPYGP